MLKQKQNKRNKNQGFQAAACTCKNKPAYASKIMRAQVLTQKHKNRVERQNWNSNNLTCILNIQTYKPKPDKHVKAYYHKEKKKTNRKI